MTIARIAENAIAEQRDDIALDDVPEHKRGQWKPIEGDPPSYNPALSRLVGPVYVIEENRVLRQWTVEARSDTDQRAAVDAERDRRIALGVTITIDATQVQIPVQTRNETDFRNLNGLVSQALVNLSLASNDPISFRDANNTVHTLTPAEMIELGSDVAAHVQSVYTAAWQLKSGVIPGDYADDQHWP